MAKEIVQADLGRIRALLDEVLGHSDYSDVQRMGGLTNRTYCVSFADGSRIMVRIPGEGTEELIDRADEKVSTELACRLGIDAKLYFFGDELLLTEYLGSKPDQNEYKHFLANKIYVDYLWTLWAKTRVPYDGQPMEDWAVERYARLKDNLRLFAEA